MDSMTEEEREQWRSERNARGVERKQEKQDSRARMEQVPAAGSWGFLAVVIFRDVAVQRSKQSRGQGRGLPPLLAPHPLDHKAGTCCAGTCGDAVTQQAVGVLRLRLHYTPP